MRERTVTIYRYINRVIFIYIYIYICMYHISIGVLFRDLFDDERKETPIYLSIYKKMNNIYEDERKDGSLHVY
jgi:hypothetical protein